MLPAIVFDLDDTLYSEKDYVFSGFRAAAAWIQETHGVPADECFTELRTLFEGGVVTCTFDRLVKRYGFPVSLVDGLVRVYRSHAPVIALFPGVRDLLMKLRTVSQLGLVTDGRAHQQHAKLDALGIRPMFEAIVITDEIGRDHWKPSPAPFTLCLRRLGVVGPQAAYVADNPAKDFLGARRNGMWTVRLRLSDGLHADAVPLTPEHSAHVEVTDVASLEECLAGLEALPPDSWVHPRGGSA